MTNIAARLSCHPNSAAFGAAPALPVVAAGDFAHQAAMPTFAPVDTIAASIQLAVTPIFLLTGVGSILNVLVTRLGRVTDRARKLEAEIPGYPSDRRGLAVGELSVLSRRMAFSIWAIALCTCSALLVCVVVAILFIGELFPMRWTAIVAVLFVLAMALLIAGLTLFLLEVQVALRSVRIRADVLTGN